MDYSYDADGRISKRTYCAGADKYPVSYTFLAGANGGNTTALVTDISQAGEDHHYEYDDVGNIIREEREDIVRTYAYDNLGQLVRVNDPIDPPDANGTTWTYVYDRGGNILEKRRYAYTTGELGECLETITYTYGDSNWKDKLTAYNGAPITYDALGNITSFNGYTYTWEHGRDLVAMTKGTVGTEGYHRVEFVYDEYGHRIQKTSIIYDAANARNNYKITDFYWSGDKLVHSKVFTKAGEDGVRTEVADLHYYYDAEDRPALLTYNGTRFMYQYNLQGDVIGIINGGHGQRVFYEYDTWGKRLSLNGGSRDDIGIYNPFLYRHYQYDVETGLYYLNSRYYSPELHQRKCTFKDRSS